MQAELLSKIGTSARAKLKQLRDALSGDAEGAREVYKVLFPNGLWFSPFEVSHRGRTSKVWKIDGVAEASCLAARDVGDPNGSLTVFSERKGDGPAAVLLCNVKDLDAT